MRCWGGRESSPEPQGGGRRARALPSEAARPRGERPGSVAHPWQGRMRWFMDSSIASAWGVRGEAPTHSLPPVLRAGAQGPPPTPRRCGCADAGARPFGTSSLLGMARRGGGVWSPWGRFEGLLGSGASPFSAARPGGGSPLGALARSACVPRWAVRVTGVSRVRVTSVGRPSCG